MITNLDKRKTILRVLKEFVGDVRLDNHIASDEHLDRTYNDICLHPPRGKPIITTNKSAAHEGEINITYVFPDSLMMAAVRLKPDGSAFLFAYYELNWKWINRLFGCTIPEPILEAMKLKNKKNPVEQSSGK